MHLYTIMFKSNEMRTGQIVYKKEKLFYYWELFNLQCNYNKKSNKKKLDACNSVAIVKRHFYSFDGILTQVSGILVHKESKCYSEDVLVNKNLVYNIKSLNF